jgi:hypothetical protein
MYQHVPESAQQPNGQLRYGPRHRSGRRRWNKVNSRRRGTCPRAFAGTNGVSAPVRGTGWGPTGGAGFMQHVELDMGRAWLVLGPRGVHRQSGMLRVAWVICPGPRAIGGICWLHRFASSWTCSMSRVWLPDPGSGHVANDSVSFVTLQALGRVGT